MGSLSRVTLLIGPSQRLRDEALASLTAGWSGPVRRISEPEEPHLLLLGLETPSIFGEPELFVLRTDQRWIVRFQDRLEPHYGQPPGGGALVILADSLDGRSAAGRAAQKAGALVACPVPEARDFHGWIAMRLGAHPQGVTELHRLAELFMDRIGSDVDGVLSAIDLVALAGFPGPLTVGDAEQLIGGVAGRPVWEFSEAVLSGRPEAALRILHASQAPEPAQLLFQMATETRRMIACHDTRDDSQAARHSGSRTAGAFHHVRRRAARWPRPALVRLLHGIHLASRQSRSGGDQHHILEMLVLNAQRLIPAGRR